MDNEQLIKQLSAESRKVPDNRKLIISKAKSEGLIGLQSSMGPSSVNNGGRTSALVKKNRIIAGIASAFVLGTIAAATIIPATLGSFGGGIITPPNPPIPPVGPILCEEELGNDYAVGAVSAAKLLGCFGIDKSEEPTAKTSRYTREAFVEPDIETQIDNFGTYMGAFGTFFDLPEDMVGECTLPDVTNDKYPNAVVIMGRYANGEKADFIMRYLEALDVEYTGSGDKYYLEGEIFIDSVSYYLEGERTFITTNGNAEAYDLVLRAYPDAKIKSDYVEMTMGVRDVNGQEVRSYDYKVIKNNAELSQKLTYLPSFKENEAFNLIMNYGGGDSKFTVNKPSADKPILTVGYEIGTKRSSFKVSQKRGDAVAVVMKNFIYDLNETEKTCTIKGYKSGLELTDEELEIPDKIIIKNDEYTVTAIGGRAFYNREEIKKLIVPSSVKSIGDYAFSSCKNIQSLELNEGLETIGDKAFESCAALKSLHLPASVTSLYGYGTSPFEYCSGLESITVAAGNNNYSAKGNCLIDSYKNLILGCVNSVIPNDGSVEIIGAKAFARSKIKGITIPSTVTNISTEAFAQCKELTKIIIPDSVDYIDYEAFWYCEKLNSITLPDKAISIRESAFGGTEYFFDKSKWDLQQGYSALYIGKHLISFESTYGYGDALPDMVVKYGTITIADGAFNNGYGHFGNYNSITLNNELELIGHATHIGGRGCRAILFASGDYSNNGKYSIQNNCLIDGQMSAVIAGCDESIIPESDFVRKIEPFAFAGCNFEEFVIPSNINSISSYAFNDSGIRKVTIPNKVSFIGTGAFRSCARLDTVIFEEAPEDKDDYYNYSLMLEECFIYCDSLQTVVFPKHMTYVRKPFGHCEKLESVSISMHNNLKIYSLVETCINFLRVDFDGTMAEWNSVYSDSHGLHFEVVCTDGTIQPDIHQ